MIHNIISSVIMFFLSLGGALIAKLFNPGIYLIYAQTFASGSFLGISILHFIPEAVNCTEGDSPYYSFIIVGIFAFFSLAEMKALSQFEYNQNEIREISDDSAKDFSIFLMHHFTALPSVWLQVTVFIFLFLHSVVIGFAIALHSQNDLKIFIAIVFATGIEKLVEAFTMTILIRNDRIKPWVFWLLAFIYSLATPATIIGVGLAHLSSTQSLIISILISISSGVFLFIGLLLWRKTFLTPFDWQKTELVIVSSIFFVSILIQALTCINQSNKCIINNVV